MKNLKTKKLYFQVYDEIKAYIVKHKLQPGDRLPTEMEMAETLGVSRNVLREAIKTLEIIGVLTSKPGVGMVLNTFNSNFLSSCMFLNLIGDGKDFVEQAQNVRKVMELGFSHESFDTITDEDIDTLQSIVDEMRGIDEVNADYYDIDMRFHRILYKRIGNDVLSAFVDSAWECEKQHKDFFSTQKSINVEKHQMIVTALKHKDFKEFYSAMEYHFNHVYKSKAKENEIIKEVEIEPQVIKMEKLG